MNTILPNNQCNMINIVWIDRGIILTIIYYILKKYDILLKKTIIINNLRYINFLKILFPKLKFDKFKKHKNTNFYFNIRNIVKYQDIIIDYLDNYDEIINTNKISLIPWFDMNDILISYEYKASNKLNINNLKIFIKNFSNCRRSNYNQQIWDIFIENYILQKYLSFNKNTNISSFLNFFNNFIKSNYTDTVIYYPKIYYINNPIPNISSNNLSNNTPSNLLSNLASNSSLNTTYYSSSTPNIPYSPSHKISSNQPSNQASNQPSNQASNQPSNQPSNQSSNQSSNQPSNQSSNQSSNQPSNQSSNISYFSSPPLSQEVFSNLPWNLPANSTISNIKITNETKINTLIQLINNQLNLINKIL